MEVSDRKLSDRRSTWRCPKCKAISSPPAAATSPQPSQLDKIQEQLHKIMFQLRPLTSLVEDVKLVRRENASLKDLIDTVCKVITGLTDKVKMLESNVIIGEQATEKENSLRLEISPLHQELQGRDQRARINNVEIRDVRDTAKMDNRKRLLLQHHKQDIVKDLNVVYILDELFTKQAISNDDFDTIYNLANRTEQTRHLLETLIQNGSNSSYEVFVDSLFKDYHWLWEKLSVENNGPMLNDSFEDSLSKGDVPRLPDHHVRREALEKEVAAKLKQLTRHKILVLHGMSGSGKTAVAISVLRDNPELITNKFNGVVFWLNMGDCKTEDDIIAQQNKLYRKASLIYSHNSYMNSSISMSSIGSNGDSHSLSSYDLTWQELRDRLKTQFLEQVLKEALLVLDEVNDKKVVEYFDVGCRILITTRDLDVVSNFNAQIIKVENSFSERETLTLFASCLDVAVTKLPRQAHKLHTICKGSPFQIGLIGAQLAENKERLLHDSKHWNYYIGKLEKKEFFILPKHNDNPMKTIEVCINSLEPKVLPLFKMLSILPDNAKVTAKVLSKLWNKEVPEVESIMKKLRSKSLIIEFYDHDQKNYTYEIHDLIMNYLRSCSNGEETRKLHNDFLKTYNYDNAKNAPVEIIDDGYIAFYIGHHILNTNNMNNKWSLFNRLYLDLKFLGNKVRLTGPADVLFDLQKYEKHITHDALDKDLLISIKAYLSTYGADLYRYPCTDIVQSILQHESKGILYTKASEIAQENCAKNELYFEFLHEQNVEEVKHSTIDVKENITSVCFLGDYVLVGTLSGSIKFFHIATNKLKKELQGPNSRVQWVGPCPVNPPIVAALFFDGTIKIHYVDDIGQEENGDVIEEESEESYNNNYSLNVTISPKLGRFLNCRWANYEEFLITHTSKMIILYNPTGKVLKVIDNFEREKEILSCVPCNYDKHAIVACYSNSANRIEIIDLTNKDKVMSYEETDTVMDILTLPGTNRIISLKEKEIIEHEFKITSNTYQSNCNMYRCKSVLFSNKIKDNLSFLSMAVNKSGSLLFVSTDDSRVIGVDLKTNTRVFDLENRRGNVISMSVSELLMWDDLTPGTDVLVTGTGAAEHCAKVWYLDAGFISHNTNRHTKVRLTTKFDASFAHTVTPNTPNNSTPNSETQSNCSTPKRNQSFQHHKEMEKKIAKKTMSLDRHTLKPLNLKGICNGNNDGGFQPLLAVIDDNNNIQIMRGRKVLTEITTKTDEQVTIVRISLCNQYVFYGLQSGYVKKYTLRKKEATVIMDVYSPVQYMEFVNSHLLVASGKNKCIIAYRLTSDNQWKSEMMQKGNTDLGSQEILNDMQGVKKRNGNEIISSSGSESSISRERMFPSNAKKGSLFKESGLVACYWITDIGLVTVESNATIKHWDQHLKVANVLNSRQSDVVINQAAFKKNVLVICDENNKGFQTFDLHPQDRIELTLIQDYKLMNRITACDLTTDGSILAMGLDSGDVLIWSVRSQRQMKLLKHHKTRVQYCSFSPIPSKLHRSSLHSPSILQTSMNEPDEDQPPLVLVTMATEILWWNISYAMKMKSNKGLRMANVISPVATPIEIRPQVPTAEMENLDLNRSPNFFFGDGMFISQDCWKAIWKGKTFKEGSKRKEILACIKLCGMNAKTICHDDKFSCFVTVDNPGQIHIMNVMKTNT